MKYYLLIVSILFTSCGTIGGLVGKENKDKHNPSSKEKKVIREAKSYLGVPYKFGGTDKRGMDCSGLVYKSFNAIDITLPRVSRDQAKQGVRISKSKVRKGDLLFFNTSGRGISHVGIVEKVAGKEIYFVHASSSRGVMVSKLSNTYWNPRFVEARRVL